MNRLEGISQSFAGNAGMNRVEGIAQSFSGYVEESPWEWMLVFALLFLAFLLAGYYINEKFILKRQFQNRKQDTDPREGGYGGRRRSSRQSPTAERFPPIRGRMEG